MTHTLRTHSDRDVAVTRAGLLPWLQSIGYQPTTAAFLSEVTLRRGSVAKNGFAYRARHWLSTVDVKFTPADAGCDVEISWDISTFGQLGTRPDMAFWKTEIAMTKAACEGQKADPAEYAAAVLANGRANSLLILIYIALLVCPFLPFMLSNSSSNLIMGLAVGSVVFVAVWLVLRGSRNLGGD